MTETDKQPFIYLAPIKGITDSFFRTIACKHFQGFDCAIAPFINQQKKSLYEDKALKDVLPEQNTNHKLVPQLLHTDPEDFLILANRLAEIGYKHINWNLGCPVPMIAKKKRGSGLLPYPEEIIALLDKMIPKLPVALSIKTRLGFHKQDEIEYLLPKLNDYPLSEIIIHTRLGKQLYKGSTKPEGFARCQELTHHTLTYNGDIDNTQTFEGLRSRFPNINRWMIGRGFLKNPFFIEELRDKFEENSETRKTRLYDYHEELFRTYQSTLFGPGHLLGRMKQLWAYLIHSFPGQEKHLKKILKTKREDSYLDCIDELFNK